MKPFDNLSSTIIAIILLTMSVAAIPRQPSRLAPRQGPGPEPPQKIRAATSSTSSASTTQPTSLPINRIINLSPNSTVSVILPTTASKSVAITNLTTFIGTNSTAPNINGYLSYDNPERPATQVDTLAYSWGIASTARIAAVRFTDFCNSSLPIYDLCAALRQHVTTCAQPQPSTSLAERQSSDVNCSDDESRKLLQATLDTQPCSFVGVSNGDALTQRVCAGWIVEAERCTAKTIRGPCGGHHALYLLRQFDGWVEGQEVVKRDSGATDGKGPGKGPGNVLVWRKGEKWRF